MRSFFKLGHSAISTIKVGAVGLGTVSIFALMIASDAGAVSLNLNGAVGGLLGGADDGAKATVDATVNAGSTGVLNNSTVDADVSIGGGRSSTNNANADVDVTLGRTGGSGTNADVLVDLFGSGAKPDAEASIGIGSAGSRNQGTTADVQVDLFGGGSSGSGEIGLPASGGTVGSGGAGTGGAPFKTRSVGTGSGSGGLGVGVAGSTGADRCFVPSATQLSRLAARHDYRPQLLASWLPVERVQIIDAGLCASVAAKVAGDDNIARLQDFIARNAALRLSLSKRGHDTSDVIAADNKNGTLVVYVL